VFIVFSFLLRTSVNLSMKLIIFYEMANEDSLVRCHFASELHLALFITFQETCQIQKRRTVTAKSHLISKLPSKSFLSTTANARTAKNLTTSPDWNCQWGPSGARIAYTRAMLEHRCFPKKRLKETTMHFKWHYRNLSNQNEYDTAVYSSLHGTQSCHLVFFDFL